MGFLPEQGSIVADKFHIDYEIRNGPMGSIYAATDQFLGRRVALKFLNPNLAKNSEWCERFQREAQASAHLTSDHVTQIYEVKVLRNGLPYIVMELLSGRTLDVVMAQTGVQSAKDAVGYILQACHALGEAHASGIVHRDLKPENLFLDERNPSRPTLKVLDFGIAKLLLDCAAKSQLTQPRQLLGTPPYMAPEQWKDCATVDQRVDIWSLGVILYELLTGHLPFPTTTTVSLRVLIESEPVASPSSVASDIPEGLSTTIMTCLNKNPDERFQNVAAFAEALVPFGGAGAERLAVETKAFLSSPPKRLEPPSERFSLRPVHQAISQESSDGVAYNGRIANGRSEWYEQIKFCSQSFLGKAVASRFRKGRKITFLVGSALTAPYRNQPGVPTSKGIIEIIRSKFRGTDLEDFNLEVNRARNQYQVAMTHLLSVEGADAVNAVIRQAVLAARTTSLPMTAVNGERKACIALERDLAGWSVSPGLASLGQLVAQYPRVFGDTILTSNFDPLIEVAIAKAGGKLLRTVLHGDGELQHDEDDGCNVVHFHGDWCRTDTLHTPHQLGHWRPKLSNSFSKILRDSTVVVIGYGGWNDVFTSSLVNAVAGGAHSLDVLWAFHSADEALIVKRYCHLFDDLREAIMLGRVLLHCDVDIHVFFTELLPRIEQRPSECPAEPANTAKIAGAPPVDANQESPQVAPRHFDTMASAFVSDQLVTGPTEGCPTKPGVGETSIDEGSN